MTIVSMANKDYYEILSHQILNSLSIYPQVEYVIIDIGLEYHQANRLNKIKRLKIIKLKEIDLNYDFYNQLVSTAKKAHNSTIKKTHTLKNYIKYNLLKRVQLNSYNNSFFSEIYFLTKIIAIKKAISKREKYLFLDADAFLINKIDELLDSKVKIGFTSRDTSEYNFKKNQCTVINSGVIYFNNLDGDIEKFLNYWLSYAQSNFEKISEQTSLTRIIEKQLGLDFLYKFDTQAILNTDNNNYLISIFDYKKFNYSKVELGFNKKLNYIIHLKSGRWNRDNLQPFKLYDSKIEHFFKN